MTPAFVEQEKLRERGLGDFGEKLLGLGIGPSALGSAGATSPSPALGPTLLTLAPTSAAMAPAGVPNDRLLSGCGCCCIVVSCIGKHELEGDGMAGLDVGEPCDGGAK